MWKFDDADLVAIGCCSVSFYLSVSAWAARRREIAQQKLRLHIWRAGPAPESLNSLAASTAAAESRLRAARGIETVNPAPAIDPSLGLHTIKDPRLRDLLVETYELLKGANLADSKICVLTESERAVLYDLIRFQMDNLRNVRGVAQWHENQILQIQSDSSELLLKLRDDSARKSVELNKSLHEHYLEILSGNEGGNERKND